MLVVPVAACSVFGGMVYVDGEMLSDQSLLCF